MPLNLVRRGGGILWKLPANGAFARPIRVVTSQHHIRRMSFVVRHYLPTSITRSLPHSSSIVGNLVRGYATSGRPKGTTNSKSTKTKKTAKKPAKKPAKKTKAPLTEAQKEEKKAKAERQHVRELKEAALKPPKGLPNSLWLVSMTSKLPEVEKDYKPGIESFKRAIELAREISPDERERFAELANANKAANQAAYEAWVLSHTPRQILEANKARRRLAKINNKKLILIHDDRLVKKPLSSWILFYQEKRDRNALVISDMTQSAAAEWKALPESEKEKYKEAAKADRKRYEREYLEVYGVPPSSSVEQESAKEE